MMQSACQKLATCQLRCSVQNLKGFFWDRKGIPRSCWQDASGAVQDRKWLFSSSDDTGLHKVITKTRFWNLISDTRRAAACLLGTVWMLFRIGKFLFLVKTLGFRKFLTKEKVSFEFPTSTVPLACKDHLLRVGRSLFGCCSGSEMCFRSIRSQNN